MSSRGNLSGYHIPHLAPGAPPSGAMDEQPPGAAPLAPQVVETDNPRLLAPGKRGTSAAAAESAAGPRPPKRKANGDAPVERGDGKIVAMFPGRDKRYPDELNRLIEPLSCKLCKAEMSSRKCARDHYESKTHVRHISAWLVKNYEDTWPTIKRRQGPKAFHCDLCDLDLTSDTHARQHYMGRKHRLVEQRRSEPSGSGFYDAAGKWVRTGSKFQPMDIPDRRYGIGAMFLKSETGLTEEEAADGAAAKSEAAASAGAPRQPAGDESAEDKDRRSCSLCKIRVTSANQMEMHLNGARHQSNLRQAEQQSPDVSPEGVDLLMYRTPTGLYYCMPCNMMMNHVTTLQQHLGGKKHLKTAKNSQLAEKTG